MPTPPKNKNKLFEIPEESDVEAGAGLEPVDVDESALPVTEPAPVAEVNVAKERRKQKRKEKRHREPEPPRKTKEELWAERQERKRERLLKQRALDITKFDGISVGGRATLDVRKSRRLTRDRRQESIERRSAMKLSVGGEEKEISEASKYMLDMIIKD